MSLRDNSRTVVSNGRKVATTGLAAALIGLCTALPPPRSVAADPLFGPPIPYELAPIVDPALEDPPVGLALGDLNSDGNLDLVVANFVLTSAISVYLGHGDGTFAPRVDYGPAVGFASVAIADFNNDGHQDVVAGADAGGALIWPGNGDGTLGADTPLLEYNSTYLTVGDLNADGNIDIVGANPMRLLLGNGDGTFESHGIPGMNGISVAIGDVNRDGKQDLVSANPAFSPGGSSAAVCIGNGDGTFQPVQNYPFPGDFFLSIAIADLNADDNPDLVVRGAGVFAIYLGDGSGAFPTSTYFLFGSASFRAAAFPYYEFAVGDLNADGKPDIAAADRFQPSPTPGITGFKGHGDGTFEKDQVHGSLGSFAVALADLNRDGRIDIVSMGEVLLNIGPYPPLSVGLEFEPATVNLGAPRKWVTATLDLPAPYFASDVDISSLRLDGVVPPAKSAGVVELESRTLTVKFEWSAVKALLEPGDEVTVTVGGTVSGAHFTASDVIRVMNRGPAANSREPQPIGKLAIRDVGPTSGHPSVRFSLMNSEPATLEVFDVHGRLVERSRVDSNSPGWQSVPVRGMSSGVYLVRLRQSGRSETARVVVLR